MVPDSCDPVLNTSLPLCFMFPFLLLYILTVMCRLAHSVILCRIILSPTAVIPLSLPPWIYLAKPHSLADCNPDKLQTELCFVAGVHFFSVAC